MIHVVRPEMLSRISQFFAKTTPLTLTLWIFALVFGVLAYTTWLPREGFPAVELRTATASGQFFADDGSVLPPDEVDELILPMVVQLEERPEVQSITTTSRPNSFQIVLQANEGLTAEDANQILAEEYEASGVDGFEFRSGPLNIALLLGEFDSLVGVRGTTDSTPTEIESEAQVILETIATRPGVERAAVVPLTAAAPGETGEPTIRQIGYNLLTGQGGSDTSFNPAATIGVVGSDGVDSIELRDTLQVAIDEINSSGSLNDGFETFIAFDFASQVETEIGSLQSNVISGIIVVALVALVLITWRASIIAAMFIFTVIATSVGVLFLAGITLNTISLFGIVLALGLFVDDAIVISEAIYNFRLADEGYLKSIGLAIKKVGAASVSGTITTIFVFAPMLFISGTLGAFITILPISVMIALAVSLVLSLVFIPFAARFLIIPADTEPSLSSRVQDKVASGLAALIGDSKKGIAAAFIGVGLSIGLTAIGLIVLAPQVPFNIFPASSDSIDISVTVTDFEDGTTIEDANSLVLDINDAAADGLGDELVNGYIFLGNDQTAIGNLRVTEIGSRPAVPELIETILEPIEEEFAGRARVNFDIISAGPPEETFPFKMQVAGPDLETLQGATDAIEENLAGLTLGEGDNTFEIVETRTLFTDTVSRSGSERFLQVEARFDSSDTTTTTSSTRDHLQEVFDEEALQELGLEADALGFNFGFESENQESFNSVPFAFGAALLSMLVLLVFQFRSITQWMLVILAVPFSFFGVFGGLLLTGNALSFFVMIGFLSLMGIAVNNTILLVDFANQERTEGATAREAIQTAVRRRFRPLVATTFTTIGGLLPLALSDPFWEPLSYTIIFGLISSTFLVLVAFPYYYLGLERVRNKVQTPWRRYQSNPSS